MVKFATAVITGSIDLDHVRLWFQIKSSRTSNPLRLLFRARDSHGTPIEILASVLRLLFQMLVLQGAGYACAGREYWNRKSVSHEKSLIIIADAC